jgi:hypothetical protein
VRVYAFLLEQKGTCKKAKLWFEQGEHLWMKM